MPAAGWIGAIAANAPDWTEFFFGLWPGGNRTRYYVLHRGITHSLAGAVVETVALGCLCGLLTRWWSGRRGLPLPSWRAVGTTVALAVFSHLYMDWQGSYGLRPFLPWSGKWYYADWVAIADPFFWLLPLIALAWGEQRYWRDAIPYVLTLAVISWPVFTYTEAAVWISPVFGALVVLAVAGWTAHWFGAGPAERARAAAAGLLVLAAYAGAQAVVSIPARMSIRHTATTRFGPAAQWAALTVVGRPFEWEAVSASADSVAGSDWAVARNLKDPRVQIALRDTPEGQAMGQFARFLTADVDSSRSPAGTIVLLRDARYAPGARRGWAVVAVPVPSGR